MPYGIRPKAFMKRKSSFFGEIYKVSKMMKPRLTEKGCKHMEKNCPTFLEGLNNAQLQAVTTTEGPLLILAGAGSGKTKVLVSRAAYLVAEKNVWPGHILALTFTNKAAGEMKSRMEAMTGEACRQMWVGTFHSICVRLLRRESEACPFDKNFVIYDDSDQQLLLKKIIAELGLNDREYIPRAVGSYISRHKNELHTPEDAASLCHTEWEKDAIMVYREYQKRLLQNNALDFDDLIMYTVRLFRKNPAILAAYQQMFHYIFVDEYQDTNHSQYQLVQLLAAGSRNICVVGDPDQSIYGWRGADIKNILDFEKDYPDATVIKLEQNYRSTANILHAANALIANNTERRPKDLWTEAPAGEPISYHELNDERAEASFIIENLYRFKAEEGRRYRDCAICYRTHAQSRAIEEGCIKYGIPYRIFGGLKFYDRKEIKDILAYLRIIMNPHDDISLLRVVNEPKRGIGAASLAQLEARAAVEGGGIYGQISQTPVLAALSGPARRGLGDFYKMVEHWRQYSPDTPVLLLMDMVLAESGYRKMLEDSTLLEAQSRLENIGELLSVAASFDAEAEEGGLENFLAQISLATDMDQADNGDDYVSLMTLHSTKGLEFPIVFLAGLEERIFPHSRSLSSEEQLEEERRLCYVGITRAREKLYLTRARRRVQWGQGEEHKESRFIQEIPEEYLDIHRLALYEWDNQHEGNSKSSKKPVRTSIFGDLKRPEPPQKEKIGLINLGDKVCHAKFGDGVVVQVKGSGDSTEIMVAFPEQGIKSLVLKYAPIKKLT